jgi:hypothetical protein
MICERCNTENLDGSQYCDECGAQLLAAPRARRPETGPTDNGAGRPADSALSAGPAGERPSGPPRRADGAGPNSAGSNSSSGPRVAGVTAIGAGGPEGRAKAAGAAFASVTPHAKLVIHRGRSVGKEFPMSEDETHIGRWDADGGIFPDVDLDADDPEAKVSRRHARITRRSEQYYIEDLGSTNGTFINRGRRLLPGDRHPLRDGDEVIVGKTFLRFHVIQ